MNTENQINYDGGILVAGDSIFKGVYYDESRRRHALLPTAFCAQVARLIKPAVENISRYGYKSGELLSALLETLKRKKEPPSIVLLEVGGNDCAFDWDAVAKDPLAPHTPNTPLPEYENNLLQMVDAVKEVGAQPILCNLPPIDAQKYFNFISHREPERSKQLLKFLGDVGRIYWWHERYSMAVERVAQLTETPLMLLRASMLKDEDYRSYICEDGMHPNETGHAKLTDALLHYIRNYAPAMLA